MSALNGQNPRGDFYAAAELLQSELWPYAWYVGLEMCEERQTLILEVADVGAASAWVNGRNREYFGFHLDVRKGKATVRKG